jgi:hypothetical protein
LESAPNPLSSPIDSSGRLPVEFLHWRLRPLGRLLG